MTQPVAGLIRQIATGRLGRAAEGGCSGCADGFSVFPRVDSVQVLALRREVATFVPRVSFAYRAGEGRIAQAGASQRLLEWHIHKMGTSQARSTRGRGRNTPQPATHPFGCCPKWGDNRGIANEAERGAVSPLPARTERVEQCRAPRRIVGGSYQWQNRMESVLRCALVLMAR